MLHRRLRVLAIVPLLALAAFGAGYAQLEAQGDAVLSRIIQLGQTDNQVMLWSDYASNRFGGRETGSNAYNDATEWAVWQFRQWGIEAQLDEVGSMPVGFNRGPWSGKMLKPVEKALRFGTPSFTAGTRGVQRGKVAILKANPFQINGRNASPEDVEKKRLLVEQAIAEVKANPANFKDRWVLIGGQSDGFARDGRRSTAEYADTKLMPPLTAALVAAGALGTIQSSTPPAQARPTNSEPPLRLLDGHVTSWDRLPVLPDIKLLNTQYDEIRAMAENNQDVELEFDIRNWFKMGPVPYHNVVATIRGTTFPDEHVVVGGHFDCFSGATGGVDDGNGFSVAMEALRLIKAAGGQPKRSITAILFAAEESGLLGSQSWLKKRPEMQQKVILMMNRDSSPTAITGATVPSNWYEDFQQITAPLEKLHPKWSFQLARNDYPSARPDRPGGSDHSSFQMLGIPTLSFRTETDYNYQYAWHTLNDLYSELVPYTEHQKHSALVTAVLAYGAANMDKPLSRAGVYLDDGIYADIVFGSGDSQKRVMASLDFVNAPLHTAAFIRSAEAASPAPAGREGGPAAAPGRAGGPPTAAPAGGPTQPAAAGGRGQRPPAPPVGRVTGIRGGAINAVIVPADQKPGQKAAQPQLPRVQNPSVKHDGAGVIGVSSPGSFYITLKANAGFDRRFTALGRVIAGANLLSEIGPADEIRSVRIVRAGQAARDFKTDDEAFKALLAKARPKS